MGFFVQKTGLRTAIGGLSQAHGGRRLQKLQSPGRHPTVFPWAPPRTRKQLAKTEVRDTPRTRTLFRACLAQDTGAGLPA